MYQIDNSTVVAAQPASTAAGTAGFFSDGNPATGAAATIVPAEFLNMVMVEMLGVLSAGGVTPSKNTYNQLATSIKALIQGGGSNYAADTGTANTYTVSYVPAITTLSDSMSLKFKAKTTNTGASTFNGKPLLSIAQAQLVGGEIVANGRCVVLYSLTLDSWILISATGGNAMSGRLINVQIFTANGTYTPTVGTNSVVVEVVGGGGAGGGAAATASTTIAVGAGGYAAAYAKGRFTSGFSGVAVTVGAGGVAAAAGANTGGTGGTSSFGTLLTAPGGQGGVGCAATTPPFMTSVQPGPGVLPSGANIVGTAGQPGFFGIAISTGSGPGGSGNFSAGMGGSGPLGAGGHPPNALGARSGAGYGSGSSGATATVSAAAQASVAGQPGIVIVYEYA